MKTKLFGFITAICASLLLGVGSVIASPAPVGGTASLTYNPLAKIIQGNQPILVGAQSYVLTLTSPSNVPSGTTMVVPITVGVLSAPIGVTNATALSFLSLSNSSLTFTGPNQQLTTTVTLAVPLGSYAGSYAYLFTTSGWPTGLSIIDAGSTLNAVVSPASSVDTSAPSVALQNPADGSTYTYNPATSASVTVPINATATVGVGQAIGSLQIAVNGSAVPVTNVGIGTTSASGTSSISLTTPGEYTITATAISQYGMSQATSDITVAVSAPPPTVSVSAPTANASYTFAAGGLGVSVPVSVSATSSYSNITALNATLNGVPVILSLSGVGTGLIASGSATLPILLPGTYLLQFTAANAYGISAPISESFTVTSVNPTPVITSLTPTTGQTFTVAAGGVPATPVGFTFNANTNFGTITSAAVTVDGNAVSSTVTGLKTIAISGSGSLSYAAAGTHTLTLTVSNGTASATGSTTFTLNQQTVPPVEKLTWLAPVCLNKTVTGGSVVPIEFSITDARCNFVPDTTLILAIYQVNSDGSTSDPVVYTYDNGTPGPGTYSIKGRTYEVDFTTAGGSNSYQIQVYRPLGETDISSMTLLGQKVLNTKGGCSSSSSNNCLSGLLSCWFGNSCFSSICKPSNASCYGYGCSFVPTQCGSSSSSSSKSSSSCSSSSSYSSSSCNNLISSFCNSFLSCFF